MKTSIEKFYIGYLLTKNPEKLFDTLFNQHWYIDTQWDWVTGMNLSPNMHVAEIGCGPGNLTRKVGKTCKTATGLDKNPRMVKFANKRNKAKDTSFYELDLTKAEHITTHQHRYDCIFGASIINVVKDKSQLIHACAEMAKPGATLHFLFPTPEMNATGVQNYAAQNNLKGFSLSLLQTWQSKSPKMTIDTARSIVPSGLAKQVECRQLMNGMIATLTITL